MSGGDLGSALDRDMFDSEESGSERRLGWYARGRVILLGVARGLTYLHSERVCSLPQTYPTILQTLPYVHHPAGLGARPDLLPVCTARGCVLATDLPYPTLPHKSSLQCNVGVIVIIKLAYHDHVN